MSEVADSGLIECGPLEDGARVAVDVLAGESSLAVSDAYGEPCDVVCVAVPAGDGVAVEAAIRRALRVS